MARRTKKTTAKKNSPAMSRFTDFGDVEVLTPCVDCVHRWEVGYMCEAFPNGIPQAILLGDNKHTTPFPGDNGIMYEKQKAS